MSFLLEEDEQIVVVGTALTAAQGIAITQQLRPDVVIIDYHLPDMDAPRCDQEAARGSSRWQDHHSHRMEPPRGTLRLDAQRAALHGCEDPGDPGTPAPWYSTWLRVYQVTNEDGNAPALDQLVLHYQPILELASRANRRVRGSSYTQNGDCSTPTPCHLPWMPASSSRSTSGSGNTWHFSLGIGSTRCTPSMWMSVNMSASDLADPGLFESISGIVTGVGIKPTDLVVEVTESVLLDDTEQTTNFLIRLKELGVGLALDDFGTAFSSLSYVRRFPFDHLKLDISFTAELPHSVRSMLLVEEICHLATSMGMKTTAEGIERQEQADALRGIGCEYGQGYLFSRPVSAAECEALLAAG